ncbi:MAG: hypothetical protein CL610_16440 [Anaerolineaceae bacterium]|nr:hypothetical protein [Anaerolineaceae bacterium]
MKTLHLIFIMVILALPFYPASAQVVDQEPAYDVVTSPVDLLASYYNAINRQEYPRAYGYWETPPDPYNDFVNGFADTVRVQVIVEPPTFVDAAAGSQYVQVSTVLIADHSNGTQTTFVGCFTARRSNLQPLDVPEEALLWQLYNADIEQVSNNARIPTLLDEGCSVP